MKLHTTMPSPLRPFFNHELASATLALAEERFAESWRHLERAHILGQAFPLEHSKAHWRMLRFGLHIKSWREVLGQIPRLLIGGVKSFVGTIPTGNTGGANVSALRPMPIPDDLKTLLNEHAGN
ncbi:DUF3703 domain-containing protein [Bradymonadaceae bacterium TMQ3]|uniref:DUF3703 domain-containing protein n=1 Tax=Lujinxingia sediminis TaxID=2480984 RepID=A0ABY0CUH1_9DELT|nr:DUF3703 domain-containing protein [Lujinxingia sediminis]RDV37491.1 DUF3703 domain-containing protein [Bradymonadaceae bacterium TMQ3]RVU45819.1 DUF3703 domain-containing protein [Lujinxingia sediminis]TXC75049.1 DUF3703 domain-containing protein [Bradymonadales bacterium TMQ1]